MSVVGGGQVPIEVIGGLVTNFDPQTLPPGVSPDCPDIAFRPGIPGSARTRPGTSTVATPVAGSKYTYLKTFIDQQGNTRNLYLSDQGILLQEFPQGTFTQVNQAPNSSFLSLGMQAKSDTAFGREFIGFSDGLHGINIPRQWNGVNFDRVSQCGPGAGPAVAKDYNAITLTALSRTTNIISGTTATPHLLQVGTLVNIVGVLADGTLNGQFPVIATGSPTTFQAWGNPGTYAITEMTRSVADTVTAVITPTANFVAGSQIVIANAGNPSFNGLFNVLTVNGNIVTWAQAGANVTTVGGTLYTNTPSFTIASFTGGNASGGNSLYTVYFYLYGDQTQPFIPGANAIIAGMSNASLDGTFVITGVGQANLPQTPAGATSWEFTFIFTTEAAPPPWGTATPSLPDSNPSPVMGVAGPAGNISAGEHQVSTSFIMRSGYITQPAPPVTYAALGGFQLQLTGIPTGSPDGSVVGRITIATAANLQSFFYSQNIGDLITAMQINDNTTTTQLVDFTDAALLGSTSADYLFDLVELGEVAGFAQYGNILTAWGERNWQKNWQNLSFDGGFSGNTPLGWTATVGGGSPNLSPVWGQLYSITGDGATANQGAIFQSAYQDTFGVGRILPNTAYSVRFLARINPLSPAVTSGGIGVALVSASLAINNSMYVQYNQLTTTLVEFIGALTVALPVVPADLQLFVQGTPAAISAGGILDIENVEIFPTLQPYNSDILYGSSVEEPENFDGVLGIQTVSAGDGKRIVTTFQIRTRLYILKNGGGLYTETADSTVPFSQWAVDPVDATVGCESINGVGVATNAEGDTSFVFILGKKGLYIFWSDVPVKVSQEIQSSNGVSAFHWGAINKAAMATAWVVTDSYSRRVLIGLPVNGSTTPNVIAQMDYVLAGASAQEIADSPPVSPTFTGQLKAHMRSRKWSPWNISSSGAGLILRADGSTHLFLGNGISNGDIYDLLDSNLFDVEGPIDAYYTTNYYPSDEQKQQILQSKGNMVLLRYLTLEMIGQGTLAVTAFGPNFVNSYVAPASGAPPITLSMAPFGDVETFMNFSAERMALKIQAIQAGATPPWFSLQNMMMYVGQDPVTTIRGWNNYDPTAIVPV